MIYVGFKPCSEARLASQIEIYTQTCSPLAYPTLPSHTIRMANNKQQILASTTSGHVCVCLSSALGVATGIGKATGAGATSSTAKAIIFVLSSPGAPLRSIQFAALHNLRCRIRLFLLLLLLDYGKAA